MSIPVYQPLPPEFTAGDTVVVDESYSDFPSSGWSAKMWFNRNDGTTPTGVDASTNGEGFRFTLSSTFTSALISGDYFVSVIVTNGSEKKTPLPARSVLVLPDFAVAQTPSTAQSMVALLEGAIAVLATTTQTSVSFNGQSFSQSNIREYQEQLVYWQSRVIAEQRKLARARGGRDPFHIGNDFVSSECGVPFAPLGPFRVQ